MQEERQKLEINKILNESAEINEIKKRIQMAQLNQERSKQISESHLRTLDKIVKDAEVDERVLQKLEEEKRRENEREMKRKMENVQSKYVLQDQMKNREVQKEESQKEFHRDRTLVDDQVKRIMQEDLNLINEDKKKKDQTRKDMVEAYEEKKQKIANQKENDRIQKEKERKYFEDVNKRQNEFMAKKASNGR